MRTVCCVCQRLKGEKGWVRVAGVIASRLSHGYCPECYQKAMDTLRDQLALAPPAVPLPLRIIQK